MKTKLEKNLSGALSQMVPNDMYERITQSIDLAEEGSAAVMKQNSNQLKQNANAKKRKRSVKWMSVLVAACLILTVGVGGTYYQNNLKVDSIVDIDVNPSIELSTNKKDKVIDVVPVNEDAKDILDDMSLKNTDLKVAVNAIIGSMVQKGYLTSGENNILVSVQNDNTEKAQNIRNLVLSDINDSLNSNQVDAAVINQTVTSSSTAREFAQNHGISLGKAAFILNLAGKDSSLDPEALAAMSLRELADLVNERNIDISDIADYDADDSVWENISEAVEEVNEEGEIAQSQSGDLITPAEAKEIALNHAGVSADQATIIKTELDHEDGVAVYEVEFYSGNREYEYEINAVTGAIHKQESENADDYHHADDHHHDTVAANTQTGIGEITSEKAKEIALNHAGVSEDQTTAMKVERDDDDGVQIYEVEFDVGQMEYSYDIDCSNGNILDYEQEQDD